MVYQMVDKMADKWVYQMVGKMVYKIPAKMVCGKRPSSKLRHGGY